MGDVPFHFLDILLLKSMFFYGGNLLFRLRRETTLLVFLSALTLTGIIAAEFRHGSFNRDGGAKAKTNF